MPIIKKPTFPKRKGTIKRILDSRIKRLNKGGNKAQKLSEVYVTEVELLKEKLAQTRRLKNKALKNKSKENLKRLEKLRFVEEDYNLRIKEMTQLLKDLKK